MFKTWNKGVDRLEAVSVMNTAEITRSGNAHVLSQEVRNSPYCYNVLDIFIDCILFPRFTWDVLRHDKCNKACV